jgi:hypothetical protein
VAQIPEALMTHYVELAHKPEMAPYIQPNEPVLDFAEDLKRLRVVLSDVGVH